MPGDEWLYYKIYTGRNTADSILVEVIKPLSERLVEEKIIIKWFFIRYGDPEFHLRVRFHMSGPNSVGTVIENLFVLLKKYREDYFIWKIQIDTYEREVERYGPTLMNQSEEIFYADSLMIINFIASINEYDNFNLRWLFGLRAIDSFLTSFQFQYEDRLRFLGMLRNDFWQEFGITGTYKRQIDKKYRNLRREIEDFMAFTVIDRKDLAPILNLLDMKSKSVKKIIAPTLEPGSQNEFTTNFSQKLGGHIHMSMNRLFKSKNRLHEMMCYDFLYRYYKSLLARQ
ncbi:thiopeptide-type bacteriocin biosynthesis protein [Maribacter sp. 2-571]|uniref:thiopeptide-type bacteriocin biosynthesis protein n=1 Tax=Maribacter sp. 2-571 TaxID=3417569 RepID=UPI003D33BA43